MSRNKIEYVIGSEIKGLIFMGNESIINSKCGTLHREADFICKCGKIFRALINNISRGHTKSCGCYRVAIQKNKKTHGYCVNKTITPEYMAWQGMKQRCYNINYPGFKNWGGRGITVCDRWLNSFENFLEDMGLRPSKNHSLDRFPNNETGIYEKTNCRWATPKQQANNTRKKLSRKYITYKNKRKSITEWCEEFGLNYQNVIHRLKTGWGIEQIFSTPNGKYEKKIYRKKFVMNGEELGIKEWATRLDVKYGTLKRYLYTHPFEDAYYRYKKSA